MSKHRRLQEAQNAHTVSDTRMARVLRLLLLALPAAARAATHACDERSPASARVLELRLLLAELARELEMLDDSPGHATIDGSSKETRRSRSAPASSEQATNETTHPEWEPPPASMPAASLTVGAVLVTSLVVAWSTGRLTITAGLGNDCPGGTCSEAMRFHLAFGMHMFVFAVMLCSAAVQLCVTHELWWALLLPLYAGLLYMRWRVHFIEPNLAQRYGDWMSRISNMLAIVSYSKCIAAEVHDSTPAAIAQSLQMACALLFSIYIHAFGLCRKCRVVMPCVAMVLLLRWLPDHERFGRGLLYLLMFSLGFGLSEYMDGMYGQLLLHQEERLVMISASSQADSQLNHVLKNRLIGSTFVLSQVHSALQGVHGAEQSLAQLATVRSQMGVTVDWIHRREMFLQLSAGTYRSAPTAVNVGAELRRTLSGHQDFELQVRTPLVLMLDADMLAVMVEEAASNAAKYKAEGSTPTLVATLTEEKGQQMLRIALDNAAPVERPTLTPEECAAAFEKGAKGIGATARSDGIGLGTVASAAKAVGGRATLRSYADSADQTHVVFCLLMPAAHGACSRDDDDDLAVSSESFSSVDCSASLLQSPRSDSFRSTIAPLPPPEWQRSPSGTPPAAAFAGGLVCVACDDSQLMRPLIRAAFESLGASRATVLGANASEISSVIDIALGVGAEDGKPAHLVLLDVNIDVDDKPFAKGNLMAIELRRRGFEGCIVLFTAGTTSDLHELLKREAANCVIMKTIRGPPLHSRLRDAYSQFVTGGQTAKRGAARSVDDGEGPTPPSTPKCAVLLELEHLDGVPEVVAHAMLKDFFDPTAKASMPQMLDELQDGVLNGQNSARLHDLIHRMVGDSKCAGAMAIAAQLEAFEQAPTLRAIAKLRDCLARTQQEVLKIIPGLDL